MQEPLTLRRAPSGPGGFVTWDDRVRMPFR
jgi:hypothetical protein